MEITIIAPAGCWRIVKEPVSEPASETASSNDIENTSFNDAYDYFPDFGI